VSFDGVSARGSIAGSDGGGGIGGVACGGPEIACGSSSVSEGVGAEATGVSVVERSRSYRSDIISIFEL
jgi:hypothetical protein